MPILCFTALLSPASAAFAVMAEEIERRSSQDKASVKDRLLFWPRSRSCSIAMAPRPGVIDGYPGENIEKAIRAFKAPRRGLGRARWRGRRAGHHIQRDHRGGSVRDAGRGAGRLFGNGRDGLSRLHQRRGKAAPGSFWSGIGGQRLAESESITIERSSRRSRPARVPTTFIAGRKWPLHLLPPQQNCPVVALSSPARPVQAASHLYRLAGQGPCGYGDRDRAGPHAARSLALSGR